MRLTPLNGMFCTWNTGYIMFKMEGNSPQPASVNNKNEYPIGGFSGANRVLRKVELSFPGNTVSLKFKVPGLKNITLTFPYMHDGRFNSLSKVIEHYRTGIDITQPTVDTLLKKDLYIQPGKS